MTRGGKVRLGIILAICCLSIVGFLAIYEPAYQGKKASIWIDQYAKNQNTAESASAIKAMGPRLVPLLRQRLQNRNSSIRLKILGYVSSAMAPKLAEGPVWPQTVAALKALQLLGPDSAPVIPELTDLLKLHIPAWVQVEAQKAFETIGPSGEQALIKNLNHQDQWIRLNSASVLHKNKSTRHHSVPALKILATNINEPIASSATHLLQSPIYQ